MVEADPRLIQCTLFLHLETQVIKEVLSHATFRLYECNTVLIAKGTVPEALFIISKGRVGIYNEDVLLAEIGEMAVMGESFLADATASATTIALTEVEMIEIKRDDFYWLALQHPRLVFNIFTINNNRLRSSNNAALSEARAREQKLQQLVEERTAELKITLAELRRTQKFRDQFMANMSHEIRTPMNAIVGLTNLLIKSPLNEQQEKYLQIISKSGANLLIIINDILDMAKLEAGKMELEKTPFNLPVAMHTVHAILGIKAEEKGITLKEQIGEGVPELVLGDETRLTQILMNLTGNAIKFTEKGNVTIAARHIKNEGDIKTIKFSVADTGIGIPDDKIEKIFESFGQASSDTTRKFGGTGLGLTISRQLVEMHGGELSVKSVYGKGSEFYFEIEYPVASEIHQADAQTHSGNTNLTGIKILLVEDNLFNQLVAVDTLHDLFPGVEVDVAEDGNRAVEKVKMHSYNMVLMDIQLPGMDGFEATDCIRKLPEPMCGIRICAMTASVTKELVDKCFASGMNDYLMKPFNPESLREKVIRNAFAAD